MTYQDLKQILNSMTEDELKQTATAYLTYEDNFVPLSSVLVETEDNVLSAGDVYFSV